MLLLNIDKKSIKGICENIANKKQTSKIFFYIFGIMKSLRNLKGKNREGNPTDIIKKTKFIEYSIA